MDWEEEMTDKQAQRYELFARFYEIQRAIDRTTDTDTLKTLEAQKEELIERLDTNE